MRGDTRKGSYRGSGTAGVCFLLVWLLVLFAAPVLGQEETGAFELSMHGQKTWTIRYGVGDPQGLASVALSPFQLGLEQSLLVDISGKALSVFTVKAHFNDQEPASMQSLSVLLDADQLQGEFGDFSLSGTPSFAAYNKQLRGARLEYRLGEATLAGVVAQIQGISETRTFVGRTAHEEVLFSRTPADQPWVDAPYLENLAGLFHYRLNKPYVEGFSQVSLAFDPSGGLASVLGTYGLEYLLDSVRKTVAKDLSAGSYVAVTSEVDYLLFRTEPHNLLRDRLRGYIDDYNKEHALSGRERKTYPFNAGTDYERAFLNRVMGFVNLVVDTDSQPLAGGGRERFYELARTDVKADSLLVEISLQGGTFRPTSEPDLADYRVVPHAVQGVVEIVFPQSFFEDKQSAMRVSFDYAISGDIFTLGLSLVPGSERVYLNDALLTRDTDYTIDYEVGALVLLAEVGDKDTIRIDYERLRGGLGSSSEYASNFYGTTLKVPLSQAVTLQLSALASVDSAAARTEQDQARTMPNRHVVTGLVGAVRLDGFSADIELGLNHDEFPQDNNQRTNLQNQVTAILPVAGRVFVSHFQGVSVLSGGTWTAFDTSDGLSGNRVYDMQSDGYSVIFATSSGLTVLSLVGEDPMSQVGNWRRFSQGDGLPSPAVRAVVLIGGTLWAGTEAGLASVPLSEIDRPASWKVYVDGPFAGMGKIVALAGDGETLYIAADTGLFALDTATGVALPLPGTGGLAAEDLLLDQRTLYVACGLGVRSLQDGVGTGWVVFGQPVHSLAMVDGDLWYGTDDGLHKASGGSSSLAGWGITALASDEDGALWIGSRADTSYQLVVWKENNGLTWYQRDETGIDGRDRSRFADIPAEGHTDQGLLGRVSFRRELGSFSISGSFEDVSPRFTSIGRLDRRDSTGWQVEAAGHPAAGLDLSLSHSYYIIDAQTSRPKATMEDRLTLGWDFGPHLGLSITSGLTDADPLHDGFDDSRFSYTIDLTHQLFENALSLGLHWSDAVAASLARPSSRSDTRLAADGTWVLSPDLTVAASWGRPMGFASGRAASGGETWTASADWTHLFAPLQTTAHYAGSTSRAIPNGAWRADHEVRLGLSIDRLDAGTWQISPSLELTGTSTSGILSASGRGNLRGTVDAFTAQANYSVDLSGLGQARLQRSDRLSVSASFTGWQDLKPSLFYLQNSSAVTYAGQVRGTVARSLTGRLLWTPNKQARDDLSFSVRTSSAREQETLSASVQNSLSYDISDVLSVRLELDGGGERGPDRTRLDSSLTGTADLALSSTWSASVSLSYLAGTKQSGALFNSLLVEVFVAATF